MKAVHVSPVLVFAVTTGWICTGALGAAKPAAAVVNVDTTKKLTLPSRRNFSGANLQIFYTGTSYLDPTMQSLVQKLELGWTRFPAGTVDDVYNWRTGDLRNDWIQQFKGTPTEAYGNFVKDVDINRGKGFNKLDDYAAFLGTQRTGQGPNSSPTHTIGVINTFTDTPQSAAALVRAANMKGLHVDVWELGNEPYFFEKFYPTATAYLAAVQPFARAVKEADPSARVAVYLQRNDKWIDDLSRYKNRFWDELYWHAYPSPPKSDSDADKLAFYNGFLANNTTGFVDGTLAPLFGNTMQLEASEFNLSALRGGLFGAVFVAEFTLRMSADPHVTQVGMHTLIGRKSELEADILPSDDHVADVLAAYHAGKTVDTSHYNFGYYLTPYGLALEVVNGVINNSTGLWRTTISGGEMVTAGTSGQTPAIFAQAYSSAEGTEHLLLTNKAPSSQTFSIAVNGKPLQTDFTTVSFGGADPTARNTPEHPNAISLRHGSAHDTITVPAYGVMDVSWKQ